MQHALLEFLHADGTLDDRGDVPLEQALYELDRFAWHAEFRKAMRGSEYSPTLSLKDHSGDRLLWASIIGYPPRFTIGLTSISDPESGSASNAHDLVDLRRTIENFYNDDDRSISVSINAHATAAEARRPEQRPGSEYRFYITILAAAILWVIYGVVMMIVTSRG
jgi:hypothetical protein